MVQRRRHANIHYINVRSSQQRVVVVGDKRNLVFLRQRGGAFLCPRANAPDRDHFGGQLGVIRKMHLGPVASSHHSNTQGLHYKVFLVTMLRKPSRDIQSQSRHPVFIGTAD